jgi:hypothetical protein
MELVVSSSLLPMGNSPIRPKWSGEIWHIGGIIFKKEKKNCNQNINIILRNLKREKP